MKTIVRDFNSLRPKYIISADGTDLKIGHGCRGLIEIRAQIEGVTSHATSRKGKNAVLGVYSCVSDLGKFLAENEHPTMGASSLNLAYAIGGKTFGVASFDEIGRLKAVGQEGNVVPDIAEFVIDIRPSSPEISVEKIVSTLKESLEGKGLKLKDVDIQMLWNALEKPPSLVFGGGSGSKEHADDESVEIVNVITTRNFFMKVLENQ